MGSGSGSGMPPVPATAQDVPASAGRTPASPGRTRVLVIGGGFAGASLAVKLAGNQDIDLTLVSR